MVDRARPVLETMVLENVVWEERICEGPILLGSPVHGGWEGRIRITGDFWQGQELKASVLIVDGSDEDA